MKIYLKLFWLTILVYCHCSYAQDEILLTPDRQLTLEQVKQVARNNVKVALSQSSWENIEKGHNVVIQAALKNMPVYGLTVGVGWNKDKPVFQEKNGIKELSPELLSLSNHFNLSSLRAHALGIGEPIPTDIIRAAMLIRLNTFLNGETGVQKDVAQHYLDFLNYGITPIVPKHGSVGEADITLASHIGLAMVGEWDVLYNGEQLSAKEAMNRLNLSPLKPIGKDFLSILSNNSLMTGQSVLTALDIDKQIEKQTLLFCLMLEGFNGNVAPFSEIAVNARPFIGMQSSASLIMKLLQDSDLLNPSDTRALQDPLSFRSMAYTLGNVIEHNNALKEALKIQINHSDDNPLTIIHLPKEIRSSQLKSYEILDSSDKSVGAIYPTSNFNFLPIATKLEGVNQSLAKLAEIMTQQLIRLENPAFTHLSRFLSAEGNNGHAFGAIQKPFLEINIKIKQLAQPLSFQSATLAGNIEDTVTLSGITLENMHSILKGINQLSAFQLLHSTQALNLRKHFKPSKATKHLWQSYRNVVPFIQQDIPYTPLIKSSITFWENYVFPDNIKY